MFAWGVELETAPNWKNLRAETSMQHAPVKKGIACLSGITAMINGKIECDDVLSALGYLLSFALVSEVAVMSARQLGIEPVSPLHSSTSLMRRLPT